MRVQLGGQTVQVRVTTTEVSGLQAQAAAETALVTIAANRAAAETAETNAEAAEVAAELARDQAVIAKDLAEEYRDETAVYAGTTNLDDFYLNTAAGLAATPSGSYFGVPGTDGVAIYRDNAGVADAGPVMPSIDYIGKRPQFIKCVAGAVTSGNSYPITPVDTNIRYSGTGENYVWVWEAPAVNDQGSGSVDVTIKNGAGTTFATISIRKLGNTALTGSEFSTGDLIMARRQTSSEDVGQRLLWMAPPNTAVKQMSPGVTAIDEMGKVPSTSRPLYYVKPGQNTHYVQMTLDADRYSGAAEFDPANIIRVCEMDMANFQADTGNCLSLNSVFTRINGVTAQDLNMLFTRLVGGVTVDTGRVPTTIGEPPVIGGKFGDAANLYTIAGPGHGFLVEPATTLTGTLNDATTSDVDTETSISVTADTWTEFYGDKLVKTLVAKCENAAHDIYCVATWVVTYDPSAEQQIRIQSTWDFTDAEVTVTPGFMRGFSMLWASTYANRCQPIVNGVAQPIETINLRDDSNITIGYPEAVYLWRDGDDERQVKVTNNFGYGYTHKENGVLVAVDVGQSESYIDNFEWGVKLYAGLFGDQSATTPRDMTGIVVTMDCGVSFIQAPARSYP